MQTSRPYSPAQKELSMTGQPDLFPLHRVRDTETSVAAAHVIEPHLGTIQRAVMNVLIKRGPMTARELENLPEMSEWGLSTVRKRVSELYRKGMLRKVGTDRSRRAPATIWGGI